jgi:hypothetical protein
MKKKTLKKSYFIFSIMKIKEVFTCMLLLNFKLMSITNEKNILNQAEDIYTELIFIDKKNFRKIKFWFEEEEEMFKNNKGKFIIIIMYILCIYYVYIYFL